MAIPQPNLDPSSTGIRFSLFSMLGILTLVAIYCAALRFSTGFWAVLANSLTFAILAVSLVWRFTAVRCDRRFWTGFQIAGWMYAALAFYPNASSAMLANHVLSYIQVRLPYSSPDSVFIEWHGTWFPGSIVERENAQFKIHYQGYGPEWDEWIRSDRLRAGGYTEFIQTGNALLTLVVAALGGFIAKRKKWRTSMKLYVAVGIGIVLIGMGVVSLVTLNEVWASALFTLTVALFVTATILIATSDTPRSGFLVAFAVFGWCYLLIHFGPLGNAASTPRLLSTELIAFVQNWLVPPPTPASPPNIGFTGTTSYISSQVYPYVPDTTATFQMIGHSQMMLLAGLCGGLLGLVFSWQRKQASERSDQAVKL